MVHYLGNKQALVFGMAAYCIYVLCFCIAALAYAPTTTTPLDLHCRM